MTREFAIPVVPLGLLQTIISNHGLAPAATTCRPFGTKVSAIVLSFAIMLGETAFLLA